MTARYNIREILLRFERKCVEIDACFQSKQIKLEKGNAQNSADPIIVERISIKYISCRNNPTPAWSSIDPSPRSRKFQFPREFLFLFSLNRRNVLMHFELRAIRQRHHGLWNRRHENSCSATLTQSFARNERKLNGIYCNENLSWQALNSVRS